MLCVETDTMSQAAQVFARRLARREFGRRGDVRVCNLDSYAADGSRAEYSAFIGLTRGNTTTGHNVRFTVNEA